MIQSWDKMYSMFKCPKIQFKMPQFLNCWVYLHDMEIHLYAETHRHLRTRIYWVEKQDVLDF